MPTIEYDDPLDDEALEWFRFRLRTEGNIVMGFALQYETTVEGKRVPVVRYDMAHGFAHRDRYNIKGKEIEKQPLPEHITLKEAVAFAEHDIRSNWSSYRADFFKDQP